jgi:hypothetical protein
MTWQAWPWTPYTLAILSPNLTLALLAPNAANIGKLIACALLCIAWHLVFRKLLYAVAATLPIFLLLPFDVLFVATYGQPPTSRALAILLDTNPNELAEYLDGRMPTITIIVAAYLAIWIHACFLCAFPRTGRIAGMASNRLP